MTNDTPFDDRFACECCGRFGAFIIGDIKLCGDCYAQRGSCCAEFAQRRHAEAEPEDSDEIEDHTVTGPQ